MIRLLIFFLFRSTLYGNFIQKISRSAGHDVYSINYLGDWGTQFATLALYWNIMDQKGILKPSLAEWASKTASQKVEYLTRCYSDAHQHIKFNDGLSQSARELFSSMEQFIRVNNCKSAVTGKVNFIFN